MSNYSTVVYDHTETNNSWYKLSQYIPEKSRILDIGCSSGNFGKELQKSKNCEVVGVDLDKEDVKRAAKALNSAYVMNIEVDDFSKLGKFDRVIFADVLEHLVDPVASLEKVKKLLNPGGQVLFSIPNMAHMGTRLLLLTGKFGYGETGLLDKTHLHFYDESEVRRIFNDAGLNINHLDWTEYYIPQKELKARLDEVGLKPAKKFVDDSKKIDAIALQYVGAASVSTGRVKKVKLPAMSPWVDRTDQYIDEYEKRANERIEVIQSELVAIKRSNSWRITGPLRRVKRLKGNKK